jgi:hypothetical protein
MPEPDMDRHDELETIVEQHISELMKHFDAIQVFVTLHDNGSGETESFDAGDGNWLARFGQVREWIISKEELMRAKSRREFNTEADAEFDEDEDE